MDFKDGSALARLAERIWEMEQCSSKNAKIHLAVDALGMPIRAIVTDGPRADCKEAIPLIQNLPCKVLLADRGYDSDEIVEHAKNSGLQPIMPPKKIEKFNANTTKIFIKNAISSKTLSFG